jgi:phenylpropionate dioxygenase-like ring-hydroxylating dioxygenase large terminal subunit
MTDFVRDQLIDTARDMLERLDSGEITLADNILSVAASHYTSAERANTEHDQVFRRLPLMLAASAELPKAGDYKALNVANVPVLLSRDEQGHVRAFLNACTHRGSVLAEGKGCAKRFTCPYHGWSFHQDGRLLGVASPREFGELDKSAFGLVQFPVYETAGLIWVVLTPQSSLDISAFLAGIDELLAAYNLENWQCIEQVTLPGANWKLAFDAHLDFYHLPVLHRDTFGRDISNLAQYYFYGPHQRLGLMSANPLVPEQAAFLHLKTLPEAQWPTDNLLFGEWILFPNVSLNCFSAEHRVMVISQVFPGDSPGESVTVQTYLMESDAAEVPEGVRSIVDFIQHVVRDEDLPMSRQQQLALESGLLRQVHFGRNESGLQDYYRWLARIVDNDDIDLADLFSHSRPLSTPSEG